MKITAQPKGLSVSRIAAVLFVGLTAAHGEFRTWTSADGRTVEAEFMNFDGKTVSLRGLNGERYAFDKSKLSQQDLQFLQEYGALNGAADGQRGDKMASPAKEAKIDKSAWVKSDQKFEIPDLSFDVLETPHFKILHTSRAKPQDIAELAERMWIDTAFFHPTFAQKFTQRKQGIFLVDDEQSYMAIGSWFAGLLVQADRADAAEMVRKTWSQSAAGKVRLPADIGDANGLLPVARVFRTYEQDNQAKNGEGDKIKGIWVPFRVHCLASDLIDVQIGDVSGFGAQGLYALAAGYGYFKEVTLTGKAETSLITADTGKGMRTTSGYKDAKSWASELKKRIRKKEVTPSLESLMALTPQTSSEDSNVLCYSFIHFLHSTPENVAGWARLCERISTSNQVPELEDMAQLLGHESAEKLQKAWVEYITSSNFR